MKAPNIPTIQTSEIGPPREIGQGARVQIVLVGVLTFLALFFLAQSDLPYEQDQGSKAAKIIDMAAHNNWLQPLAGESVYRDDLFSFYYIVGALVYEVTGGNVFAVMNRLSAVLGAICFTALAWGWYRGFGIAPLAAWPVLMSMPILVVTFLYGNEAALALTLLALALLSATLPESRIAYLSPVFMVLACFSRADMALVAPYWVGWSIFQAGLHRPWRDIGRQLIGMAGVFGASTLLYWSIFLRQVPELIGGFEWAFIPVLFAAYVTQAFCVSIALIGGIGTLVLLVKKHRYAWIHLLLLIPLAFYAANLSSPKYVIVLALFYGLPTALLLTRFPRSRILVAAAIIPWWFVAVSPGGLHGPSSGPLWYLPTADGALPSGAFATSYDFMRRGIYQERYRAEIEALSAVLRLPKPAGDGNLELVGNFNTHFITLASARELESPKAWEAYVRRWDKEVPGESVAATFVMAQPSYLQLKSLEPAGRARLQAYLRHGQCRAIDGKESPFPAVIEVGPGVSSVGNGDLCHRILFAEDYYSGNLSTPRSQFFSPYRPLTWIPSTSAVPLGIEPVYRDAEYFAVAGPGEIGEIYSLTLPARYYREQEDPKR